MDRASGFFDFTGFEHAVDPALTERALDGKTAIRLFKQKYPDISPEILARNQLRLLQMAQEFDNCAVCMSLDNCKNALHGYQYALRVDQITYNDSDWQITESVKPCRKYGKPH